MHEWMNKHDGDIRHADFGGDADSPTSGLQNLLEVRLTSSFICILCKPQIVCQLVHQVRVYLQSKPIDTSAHDCEMLASPEEEERFEFVAALCLGGMQACRLRQQRN